jgi:hypothetical protein
VAPGRFENVTVQNQPAGRLALSVASRETLKAPSGLSCTWTGTGGISSLSVLSVSQLDGVKVAAAPPAPGRVPVRVTLLRLISGSG